jgi:hypothetical protein
MILKEKRRRGVIPFSILRSLKIFKVLLIAPFLETHVLVITSLVICLWLGHRNLHRAIAYHTRLPQLCEYGITKAFSPRELWVLSRFSILNKCLI